MSLTVALTGASGFIGNVLAHHLRREGFRVRALLRSPKNLQPLQSIGVQTLVGKLDHPTILNDLVDSCDAAIYCAGAIGGLEMKDFEEANVVGVSRLVEACLRRSTRPQLVLVSSLAAREPTLSPYANSKREGEVRVMQEAGPLLWAIFRPPAVYGPQDKNLRFLFRLMQYGIGVRISPKISRFSLIHVDDLARAIIEWIKNGEPSGKIFELDDGFLGGYTWEDVFNCAPGPLPLKIQLPKVLLKTAASFNETLSRMFGYVPLFTRHKVAELLHPDWVCDSTVTQRFLKWRPQIPLEQGLRQMLTSDSLKGNQ